MGCKEFQKNRMDHFLKNNIYKTNPTNTGGKAIKELKKALRFFSIKIFNCNNAEIGNAKILK